MRKDSRLSAKCSDDCAKAQYYERAGVRHTPPGLPRAVSLGQPSTGCTDLPLAKIPVKIRATPWVKDGKEIEP